MRSKSSELPSSGFSALWLTMSYPCVLPGRARRNGEA